MAHRHSAYYEEVLASERWRLVRAEAIRRAGYHCSVCGRGGRLDVHHARGYHNLGNEQPEELRALRRTCHDTVHAQRQVVNAGCLGIIFGAIVIAIGLELAWWVLSSLVTAVLHHVGLF